MALTGDELVMVYGGTVSMDGDDHPAPTQLRISQLRTDGDNDYDNTLLVCVDGGGPSISGLEFYDLDPDDTTVKIGLLSGGMSFTRADFTAYVAAVENPGIMIDISVTKRGSGYSVGDTVVVYLEATDTTVGIVRILEVDHFGGIVRAKVINPDFAPPGPHPTNVDDSTGHDAEVFVTTRNDEVSGVIQEYGVDGSGSGWRVGDTFTIMGGVEDASGVVTAINIDDFPTLATVVSATPSLVKALTSGTQGTGVVLVAGDVTTRVPVGRRVSIDGSTGNDGIYYVSARSFATAHTSLTLKGPPKGTITLSGLPDPDDTVTINGQDFTFVAASPGGNEVLIGADVTATAASLSDAINAWQADRDEIDQSVTATHALGVVTVTYVRTDLEGETISLEKSGTNIAVSGAHLVFQTALPSAVMNGNVIIPPEIAVLTDTSGADLYPTTSDWRFTGIFEESDTTKKVELTSHAVVGDVGIEGNHDQYTLFIDPYSEGTLDFQPTVNLAATIAGFVAGVSDVDLYVFGSGFTTDDSPVLDGAGIDASVGISGVLDYSP